MAQQTKDRPVIGLDIGRSAVKVAYQHQGQKNSFVFPSNVCLAHSIVHEETAAVAEKETVEVDGKHYFTGETARNQGGSGTLVGMSDEWIERPEYRALVAAAVKRLSAVGVSIGKDALIVIGSPSSLYESHRLKLAEITRKVVGAAAIKVLPQPSGAYFSFILDEAGGPMEGRAYDPSGDLLSWAVIEVGHYTTDFIMIRDGQVITKAVESTEGVGLCIDALSQLLSKQKIKATDQTLTGALSTGTIKHFGKVLNIQADIDEAVAPIKAKILAKADALLDRDASSLEGILLAGGGSPLTAVALKEKWSHVTLLSEPRMAVANGFLRYGLGVTAAQGSTPVAATA